MKYSIDGVFTLILRGTMDILFSEFVWEVRFSKIISLFSVAWYHHLHEPERRRSTRDGHEEAAAVLVRPWKRMYVRKKVGAWGWFLARRDGGRVHG